VKEIKRPPGRQDLRDLSGDVSEEVRRGFYKTDGERALAYELSLPDLKHMQISGAEDL